MSDALVVRRHRRQVHNLDHNVAVLSSTEELDLTSECSAYTSLVYLGLFMSLLLFLQCFDALPSVL